MPDCTKCEELKEVIKKKDGKISDLEQKIAGYEIKIKELNDQKVKEKEETEDKVEELDKEIKQLKEEIEKLKEEENKLKKEIEKLKEKLERMESLENEVKANEKRHRKELEEMKNTIKENEKDHQTQMKELEDGYKNDMRELEGSNAARIQELKKDMKERLEVSKCKNEEIQKLREENERLKNNAKNYETLTQRQHLLYLGQICSELQDNLYRYVMPKDCCSKYYNYKIKDIEKDIKDKSLLNDEQRKEAEGRFEELKKRIDWEELHGKLIGTIKQLQYQRVLVAHPPNVDEEGAIHAVQELNKQDQLKGKIEMQRVMQVIKIWSISKSMLGDPNFNY